MRQPLNLHRWIEEHCDMLRPPVGNQLVWQDTEFVIMVVGGPNARLDFHVNQGEEFFYQLEGTINLKVIEDGQILNCPIGPGEIFLLPPGVPHSPQRPAGTVGLVIERRRHPGELDGFQWYCEHCNHKMYEEFLAVTNLVTQLPPIFERFYQNPQHSTCVLCNHRMVPPVRP